MNDPSPSSNDGIAQPPTAKRQVGGGFATTRWTMVSAAAGGGTESKVRQALEELCQSYWQPLYVFALRKGHDKQDAQDLTQDFFAHLLSDGFLARANAHRGRFRTFLLTVFERFAASKWRRENAQKRGGSHHRIEFDFEALVGIPRFQDHETPERIYLQQWAMTLLARVVEQLQAEFEAKGNLSLLQALEGHWSPGGEKRSYDQVAEELGMTPGSVKVAAHRLRNRYQEILREFVAETVETEDQVEDEIRDLMNSFASPV